jgi:RHS repeat-associated protein
VSSSVAGTTTTYTYDGLGKRLQASTGSANNKKTNFLWDISGSLPQIALERDGGNSLVRRYTYGARRLTMSTGSSPYYYHYDPLGSAVNLTSSSGATEWTDAYDPFGTVHSETKNDTKAPTNVMKFVGEYQDSTGLYHLRARQYDSTTGRFLTTDPLPAASTVPYLSAYAYANDSPMRLFDPTGMGAVGNTCGSFLCFLDNTPGRVTHDVHCAAVEHPALTAVGTTLVAVGLAYTGVGIAIDYGVFGEVTSEYGGTLGQLEGEYGQMDSAHLVTVGGVGQAGVGAAVVGEAARC